MVRLLIAVALIVGTPAAAHAACADPVGYGAYPDDGLDDSAGITAALTTGAACLGPGVWDLEYHGSTGSVIVHAGEALTGAGPSTVIRQHGDGHLGTWPAIVLKGGYLARLRVYQDAWNLDAAGQTHMVQIEDSTGSTVTDVQLGPGSAGAGDCLRFLGNTNAIYQAQVTHVTAVGCWRSGVSVQHGVNSATVSGSVFHAVVGQGVDYEPTSAGAVRISWTGNVFLSDTGLALTLSDKGENGSVLVGNLVLGSVQAVRATGVLFESNTVLATTYSGPVFQVVGAASGTRVVGNYFYRPLTAPAGYVVQFLQQSGGYPSHINISDNRIYQNAQMQAIQTEGLQYAVIAQNDITAVGWSAGWHVSCRSVTAPCDGLIIANNLIESLGPTNAAIELSGYSTNALGRVLVLGNLTTYGLRCDNAVTGPVVVQGNTFAAGVGC